MTDNVTAPEFVGVVGGASAAGGHYVYLVIRLGAQDVPMLIEKSRVGELMAGLASVASLARKERVRANPDEAQGIGHDTAYALTVAGVSVGRSAEPGHAILDVVIDSDVGQLNLYLAAAPPALERLGNAAARAQQLLQIQPGTPAKN